MESALLLLCPQSPPLSTTAGLRTRKSPEEGTDQWPKTHDWWRKSKRSKPLSPIQTACLREMAEIYSRFHGAGIFYRLSLHMAVMWDPRYTWHFIVWCKTHRCIVVGSLLTSGTKLKLSFLTQTHWKINMLRKHILGKKKKERKHIWIRTKSLFSTTIWTKIGNEDVSR